MRTVLTYLLCLALFLLVGYRYVNRDSGLFDLSSNTASQFHKAKLSSLEQSVHYQKSMLDDEKQSVFSVEDEDDDAALSRKNIQFAGYFIALIYAAFILQAFRVLNKRLIPVSRPGYVGPQIYLLQGALLI